MFICRWILSRFRSVRSNTWSFFVLFTPKQGSYICFNPTDGVARIFSNHLLPLRNKKDMRWHVSLGIWAHVSQVELHQTGTSRTLYRLSYSTEARCLVSVKKPSWITSWSAFESHSSLFSCSFFATFEAVFAKKTFFFFLVCFCFALFLHLFDIDSMKLSLGPFFIRLRVLMIFSFKCSGSVFAFLSFRSRWSIWHSSCTLVDHE